MKSNSVSRPELSAYINPFVLVLASAEPDEAGDGLSDQVTGWVSFAGRLSRDKPAVIYPHLYPHRMTMEAVQISSRLRGALVEKAAGADMDTNIAGLRQQLSNCIDALVFPAAKELLVKLGADRMIVFSDLDVDFLPFRHSVLGLEMPVCRYPSSMRALDHYHRSAGNAIITAAYSAPITVAVLASQQPVDKQDRWANDISKMVSEAITTVGLRPIIFDYDTVTTSELMKKVAETSVVIFFGHGAVTANYAWITLDRHQIYVDDIRSEDWSGKLIILMACETAAHDTEHLDIARVFLERGARAVIAATTLISMGVANVFFLRLFHLLKGGMSIEYAFFHARRYCFIMEVAGLRSDGANAQETEWLIADLVVNYRVSNAKASGALSAQTAREDVVRGNSESRAINLINADEFTWDEFIGALGLGWLQTLERAPYSLAFSLYGGFGETVR